MSERFEVVVVGSGAGGGVVAGELASHGRRVLLLEGGPHRTAADFTRWEAKAAHDLWWPVRFAAIPDVKIGAAWVSDRPRPCKNAVVAYTEEAGFFGVAA